MRTVCNRRLVEQTARCEWFELPKSGSSLVASLYVMYTLVHTLFLVTDPLLQRNL
jgi:hypothetical protein